MIQITPYFAAAEASDNDLLGALGIDWRLLILQIIAFGVLVWFLNRFVFPHLIKAIDKREQAIADSVKAANEAEVNAEKAQAEVEKLLQQAREEATELVDTAHKEAASMVKDAEDKAKKRAEQIVADARAQLELDVLKARKALRADTAELVALATERIIREKVDSKKDSELIETAIKEAK